MNILIIGGYTFKGIKLAEKFVAEENSVTILDEDKSSSSKLKAKHKYYQLSSKDRRISKVFESGNFDLVVYVPERENDLKSLSNVLESCTKNNVKKFMTTSDHAVYSSQDERLVDERMRLEPKTPKGMSELVKEYYCLKWGELNGLNVVVLRHSNLYGPKEETSKKQSVVFRLVKSIIARKPLLIDSNVQDSEDYLYIDDFTSAVYMLAVDEAIKGIFNISSGKGLSIERLIKIFEEKEGFKKPKVSKKEKGEKKELVLDNKKIMQNIKWRPQTDIKKGLEKTLEYYLRLTKSKKERKKFLKEHGSRTKKRKALGLLAYLENIGLFLGVAFLQYSQLLFGIRLFDLKVDYTIVYIIIIGILWGQTQAYVAIGLSSLLYIGVNIYSGMDIVTFLYIPENLLRLAVYVLVGIVTGYAIDRKNRDIEAKDVNIKNLKDKYGFLLNVYNQTKVIKDELEDQIIDSEDSFGAVYSIIQQLESLEIEKIFSSSIFALEKILKTEMVSIYTTNSDGTNKYMRLKARSLALEGKVPNSIKIDNFKELKQVFDTKKIFINKELDKNLPVMMAPILDRGKVIAVVSIHKVNFDNLTMHYENLFQTVIGLITNTLKRAYIFEASLRDKRYIDNTRILTHETFDSVLEEIRNNKEELGMSYALLKVTNSDMDLSVINEKIIGSIRDNDYIGFDKNKNLYILLSNTKENYAGIVQERLSGKGIYTKLVKDDIDT